MDIRNVTGQIWNISIYSPKTRSFNFDFSYLWYPLRYRVIQHLIAKLLVVAGSSVKLSCSSTHIKCQGFLKMPIHYIDRALSQLLLTLDLNSASHKDLKKLVELWKILNLLKDTFNLLFQLQGVVLPKKFKISCLCSAVQQFQGYFQVLSLSWRGGDELKQKS